MATKPTRTPVETVQDVAQDAVSKIQDTFTSMQEKLEVPEAAREFVQRTAATARERLADAHAGANRATATYEKAATSLIGGSVTALRGLLQAQYENTVATIGVIERLASAKSFTEAYQIQTDFARDYTRSNWARVQEAAETVKANVQDSVKLLQDETAKVMSTIKKAA